MLGIKEKLRAFQTRLTEKAAAHYQETVQLQQASKTLSQGDAVKIAQFTIRSLVLLDIADIVGSLID